MSALAAFAVVDGIRAIPGVKSVQVMPYSEDTIPNLPT